MECATQALTPSGANRQKTKGQGGNLQKNNKLKAARFGQVDVIGDLEKRTVKKREGRQIIQSSDYIKHV